ncbi:MAG: flagellar hook-length control protein FliK [Rubrivivax sp.]|nr:flagellar hook-length control protein FliK [Rubrivivax sp.]
MDISPARAPDEAAAAHAAHATHRVGHRGAAAADAPRGRASLRDSRTGLAAIDPTAIDARDGASRAGRPGVAGSAEDAAAGRSGTRSDADFGPAVHAAASATPASLLPLGAGWHAASLTGAGADRLGPQAGTSEAGIAAASLAGLAGAGALAAPPAAGAPALAQAELANGPGSGAFARELGTQLVVWAREGVQQAQLELHPQELGPVQVRIRFEGSAASAQAQGQALVQVQVQLTADAAATRQALEQALPTLASQLADAGFTLAGGGVFERPRGEAGHGQAGDSRAAGDPMREGAAGPAAPGIALLDAAPAGHGRTARGLVDLVA